jgi:hypothetical protein
MKPTLMYPTKYAVFNSWGAGPIKTAALQKALLSHHIGHLQFVKVTSVLPWKAQEIVIGEISQYPAGMVFPAVLSVDFLPFPPDQSTVHGTALFFLPHFLAASVDFRYYLLLEDTFSYNLSEEPLTMEGLEERLQLYQSLYYEVTTGKLSHFLPQYGRVERMVSTAVVVRLNHETWQTEVSVRMVDTAAETKEDVARDCLDGTGWICLVSGVILLEG